MKYQVIVMLGATLLSAENEFGFDNKKKTRKHVDLAYEKYPTGDLFLVEDAAGEPINSYAPDSDGMLHIMSHSEDESQTLNSDDVGDASAVLGDPENSDNEHKLAEGLPPAKPAGDTDKFERGDMSRIIERTLLAGPCTRQDILDKMKEARPNTDIKILKNTLGALMNLITNRNKDKWDIQTKAIEGDSRKKLYIVTLKVTEEEKPAETQAA